MSVSVTSTTPTSNGGFRSEAKERVREAILTLVNDPQSDEVPLVRVLSDRFDFTPFGLESVYREIAGPAGYGVTSEVRQTRRGYEHLLYLVRGEQVANAKDAHPRGRASLL